MKIQTLLNKPNKWIKGNLALSVEGFIVNPLSEDAVCWCLWGAIDKCYPGDAREIRKKILDKVGISITGFNDNANYQQVMALVKELDI